LVSDQKQAVLLSFSEAIHLLSNGSTHFVIYNMRKRLLRNSFQPPSLFFFSLPESFQKQSFVYTKTIGISQFKAGAVK